MTLVPAWAMKLPPGQREIKNKCCHNKKERERWRKGRKDGGIKEKRKERRRDRGG